MARTPAAVALFPIDWGLEPEAAENPRALRCWVTVEAGVPFTVNLEQNISSEQLSNVQSIYIDNSDGSNPVQFIAGKSKQNLTIPQGCQAYLPFLFGDDFQIEVTRADAGRVPFWLVNMPMPALVWSTEAAGATVTLAGGVLTSITDPVDVVIDDSTPIEVNVQQPVATTVANGANVPLGATTDAAVTNPATNGTIVSFIRGLLTQAAATIALLPAALVNGAFSVISRSSTGTLSTVTGTGASISVLAANANRRGASINNLSGVTVSLRLQAAAASAANASVTLTAGQYYETPFGYQGEIRGLWASGDIAVTEYV